MKEKLKNKETITFIFLIIALMLLIICIYVGIKKCENSGGHYELYGRYGMCERDDKE